MALPPGQDSAVEDRDVGGGRDSLREGLHLAFGERRCQVTEGSAFFYADGMATQQVFVGREQQVAQLREVLSRRTSEAPGIVLVAGEAGIGKSRLVREALRQVDRPVLYGVSRIDTANPYAPIVDILRAYLRGDAAQIPSSPLIEHVRLLLPELGPAPTESDPRTLSEAICEFLAAAGGSGSLLVLEDLQWADGATLELLTKLPRVQERCELRLLATYRSDEISRLHQLRRVRSELRREGHLLELALDPLSREETKQLVSELHPSLSEGVMDAVYERSHGIPFFVEELAAVAGNKSSSSDEQVKRALPETLADAIRMRVAPLAPTERDVLQLMAAAGATVDLALLSDIADADSLMSLTEHRWLIRIEGRSASFRHELVRDAVYEDISWARRRELHRFLAQALEERPLDPKRSRGTGWRHTTPCELDRIYSRRRAAFRRCMPTRRPKRLCEPRSKHGTTTRAIKTGPKHSTSWPRA